MVIWYDITNSPQVHFLVSIMKALRERQPHKVLITSREFSETTTLLSNELGCDYQILGDHKGRKLTDKVIGVFSRFWEVYNKIQDFDISISCGSESAIWSSTIRHKKTIAFGDNDQARQWTYGFFVNHAFFPDAISEDILIRQGLSRKKLTMYHGFKEDIYIADYKPSETFLSELPFERYVVVRPENLMANYIRNSNATTITPELLRRLSGKGHNILYLPRYKIDHSYAKGIKNVFIPESPLNGLDACYYAEAVLTGAGTFAREAACLGVPAFSFYAGKQLLSVDRALIKTGAMFFSRDVSELINQVSITSKKSIDLTRSKCVKDEVISKLSSIIEDY